MKHVVIVGATSAMAEHCARLWAERENVKFTLIARNRDKCIRVKEDLESRNPNTDCTVHQTDFASPEAIRNTIATISDVPVDIALIAHGTLPEQADCEKDIDLCEQTLTMNGTSPALFAEAFSMNMEPLDHGHIVLIGSVAGDRGRKSNYVYGAAKGLVAQYAQGLQHRFAGTGVTVTLVKPGPTKTPMTNAMQNSGSFAEVEDVAKQIVKAIDAQHQTVYVPKKWQIIMFIIRNLPNAIFKRLNI
ncbi:SDR family NAD(P)-dependent oxidoreductase [uncultured Marinobacter sp.]|uniref:SDR family NAD(P)-dependent oxidoreductase n=1 Tax=uncultured Marinobacter sp. TaxID=187379 RepID=UPI0030D98006|tara:strand:- start:34 stop:771 length:738 start_codon:yes stop_codon:yes gene_type:complete